MIRTGFAEDDDPLTALHAALQARRAADRALTAQVRRARNHGLTWQEIATLLGTTPRRARRDYAKT
ncbi:hypothetical protein GCM10009678_22900 [Actinomadura kijaniata]|uniref:Uncharacterized protein n=1 Tax=Actinomadura namibiensis TaxID=182080 RepID=A0A7W3LN51_ACTNM|nr:AsnC family protein [Actinomadura namibiensis]MBA8951122.1 hypothetical protein [Actinomadura namibiensis]